MRTTWEFSKGVNNQYLLAELWPSVGVTNMGIFKWSQ